MSQVDVLVIGGGPAGMSAAIEAGSRGLRCLLIDESAHLGGQIYRPEQGNGPVLDSPGERLRRRVAQLTDFVEIRRETTAFAVLGRRQVAIRGPGGTESVQHGALVLAPGAYEFAPPFPGWTLPGVMTPGAAQILAKTAGVVPGRRILVAGTGPFLLVVACHLLRAGADVIGVLEVSQQLPWLALPLRAWRTMDLLGQGMGYLRTLRRAGVPMRYGRVVVSADGEGDLASVTHAPVDSEWRPIPNRSETQEADTLCVGYGFVPRTYLAQMAGCELDHHEAVGGWVPRRDRNMRTTVEGVYTAGDGASVAGALVAALEGQIAGLAAAHQLGAIDDRGFADARQPLDRALRRLAPFRCALDAISRIRPGLHSLVEDSTVVCRCEEVRWKEACQSIGFGGTTFRTMKVQTRLGMGPCQGRFCWPAMSRMISHQTGVAVRDIGPASPRPPIAPVTMGELASATTESS